MKDISAMDMLMAIRKGIQDTIKENPEATAQDVLDGLELTTEITELLVKRLSKK